MPTQNLSLAPVIEAEIVRLSEETGVSVSVFQDFARFVIHNKKAKRRKQTSLTLPQLKAAVYQYFDVVDTQGLKKSNLFKMATNDIKNLNLRTKENWKKLYRKYVGILPSEEGEIGQDCINGINIFTYFRPWEVFGLDNTSATEQEIKDAYRRLSKIYHPDNSETGDAKIFDRIHTMYQSIMIKI